MIGYIGLSLLVFSYILLNTKEWVKYFIPVDMVASFILTIHAIMIKDTPFVVVNGIVTLSLLIKLLKKETL